MPLIGAEIAGTPRSEPCASPSSTSQGGQTSSTAKASRPPTSLRASGEPARSRASAAGARPYTHAACRPLGCLRACLDISIPTAPPSPHRFHCLEHWQRRVLGAEHLHPLHCITPPRRCTCRRVLGPASRPTARESLKAPSGANCRLGELQIIYTRRRVQRAGQHSRHNTRTCAAHHRQWGRLRVPTKTVHGIHTAAVDPPGSSRPWRRRPLLLAGCWW